MLAELTEILGRRKFAKKIAALQRTIDQLVDGYTHLAALVRPDGHATHRARSG